MKSLGLKIDLHVHTCYSSDAITTLKEVIVYSKKRGLDGVDDIEVIRGAFISRGNKVGQVGKLPQIFKIEGNKKRILRNKLEDIFPGDYEIFS